MLKKKIFQTTPFLIFTILGVLWVLFETVSQSAGESGWRDLAIYSVLPFILIAAIIDVVLKLAVKTSLRWNWIIEAFLSLCFIYYWIVR